MDKLLGTEIGKLQSAFLSAFQLDLCDSEPFIADQVLRLVQKKRLLAFGHWRGQRVFAKLFFHKKSAHQHFEQEVLGSSRLLKQQVLTPKLLFHGLSQDKKIYVLLFEYIADAKELREIWDNKVSVANVIPLLERLMQDLARYHQAGVLQEDLNLKNFLITFEKIVLIDTAHIQTFSNPVPDNICLHNLALLMSYCGVQLMTKVAQLFASYCQARGWFDVKKNETRLQQLYREINTWKKSRWWRYKQKMFVSSRDFVKLDMKDMRIIYDRHFVDEKLLTLLTNIRDICDQDAVVTQGSHILSMPISFAACPLLLKKFSKTYLPTKYDFFKTNPALKTWLLAHRVNFFGLKTPRPVAIIEIAQSRFSAQYYYLAADSIANDTKNINSEKLFDFLQHLLQMRMMIQEMQTTDFSLTEQGEIVLVNPEKLVQFKSIAKLKYHFERALGKSNLRELLQEGNVYQHLNFSPIQIPI